MGVLVKWCHPRHILIYVTNQKLDLQRYTSWYMLMFNDFRREITVRFVYITIIIDHYSSYFLLIIKYMQYWRSLVCFYIPTLFPYKYIVYYLLMNYSLEEVVGVPLICKMFLHYPLHRCLLPYYKRLVCVAEYLNYCLKTWSCFIASWNTAYVMLNVQCMWINQIIEHCHYFIEALVPSHESDR